MTEMFKKENYYVTDAPFNEAKELVKKYHYSKGGSNTFVYVHGLYEKQTNKLVGIAWWLPPTKVACQSVNKDEWTKVLSLTRMVVVPNVPKNACSFLLSKSIKLIKKDKRFVSLVTYADDAMNHTGTVYKASNWTFVGKTGPYPKWIDPETGRQVAQKATKNRVKKEMEELGYKKVGSYYKYKYVIHLYKKQKKINKMATLS